MEKINFHEYRWEICADNLLNRFREFGCNMNLKVHYFHIHFDRFSENLGNASEEHGEGFHPYIKRIEEPITWQMGYSYDGRFLLEFASRL
ncbi:hypothetical protein AVEN_232375-1 [Araneus ventricosus]|uniref:Uncharacterized protein n=1 Tax=Araneus ventricosus TaxID=182803 RepID=A0A4Y2CU77_ARAVE|nr:hypothetical protein AVEN_232375-1 [Araneus ventricosus]